MISATVDLYSDVLLMVIVIIFAVASILMLAIKNNNIKTAILKRIIIKRNYN